MSFNRRSFIKSFSLAMGGVVLAPKIPFYANSHNEQFVVKTKRKYGVALIGLGYYSTDLLAPALLETKNCYLAGIVTGTPEKKKIWAEKYNLNPSNIYNYSNFDSIKNNTDIDYVYVVLPNSMHKDFTIRAAKAGKHVLCEKPMAVSSKDCLEMIQVCKDTNRKLSIGYRLHYDLTTKEIKKWKLEKTFGDIRYLHAAAGFTFSKKWDGHWKQKKQYGGGALMDMGVYSIQAARYTTGMEPTAVIAAQDITTDLELFPNVEQGLTFQLEFPNNITANLMTSFACNINDLSVTASKGWYRLKPFSSYRGIKGSSKNGLIDFPSINQQAAHMDDFALSIENDTQPLVSGEEGYKDLVIVEAIKESLRTGGRVNL